MISIFHTIHLKNTFEQMEQTEKKFSKRRVIDFFIDLIIHVIANEKGLKYFEKNYLNEEKNEELKQWYKTNWVLVTAFIEIYIHYRSGYLLTATENLMQIANRQL